MTEHDFSRQENREVSRLVALLRRENTDVVDADHHQREWQRLLLHTEDPKATRAKSLRSWVWYVPATAAILLILGLVRSLAFPTALQVRVAGRPADRLYFTAGQKDPLVVDFSDGSKVTLCAEGLMRVSSLDGRGAGLLLERGRLDLSIARHRKARWHLDAGPYRIQVTGTRFSVVWDPRSRALEVDLEQGGVSVTGPGFATPVALQPGQHLHTRETGRYTISPRLTKHEGRNSLGKPTIMNPTALSASFSPAAQEVARPTVPSLPLQPAYEKAASLAAVAATSQKRKLTCDWAHWVGQGQFEHVVNLATHQGVKATLEECPAAGLVSLADAARYMGNFDLSHRALISLRRRSPSDTGRAAFLLGRLEEARGNYALARDWYAKAQAEPREKVYEAEAAKARARLDKRVDLQMGSDSVPLSK